ncbi:MAG TPA: prepilin-type N-terminal cleavage/methylation domain-containing protein [Desulfobacteraceae bacterium]|nr:prepilin-type N-terminal cleavage/methylation domain-containing protein [Desulfobacteraceae bacterium]HPJ67695.1 prepilin-type N-terminal cleavage/methylation domain-containing protein [Desulfobacteraceae bacterium]HPQ29572.1 prepilin-type N-terminal cleavage/methylation domain-containing protein [Desulfobacteraceae bacterium]
MDREQAGQQGFSLVEIMIAVAVFAIGILGVGAMQVKSINTDSQSSRITEVATTLEQLMERITAYDYSDLWLNDTDGDGTGQDLDNNGVDDRDEVDPPPVPLFNFGLNDTFQVDPGTGNIIPTADHFRIIGNYTVYWNVAVDQPTRDLKTIRAIIFWTEGGRQRRITLDSVKPAT